MPLYVVANFEVTERVQVSVRSVANTSITTIRNVMVPRLFRDRREVDGKKLTNDFITIELIGNIPDFMLTMLGETGKQFIVSGRIVMEAWQDKLFPTLKGNIHDLSLQFAPRAEPPPGDVLPKEQEVDDLPF